MTTPSIRRGTCGHCSVCKDKYARTYALYPKQTICAMCLHGSLDYDVCTNCRVAVHRVDVVRNPPKSPACPNCGHAGTLVTIGWYDKVKAHEALERVATMLERAAGKPERHARVIRIATADIRNALRKLG